MPEKKRSMQVISLGDLVLRLSQDSGRATLEIFTTREVEQGPHYVRVVGLDAAELTELKDGLARFIASMAASEGRMTGAVEIATKALQTPLLEPDYYTEPE